jgi:DNA repair protein RadC
MNSNLSIKAWADDDRPREKMVLKGRKALSDAELIAILIGSGTREKSAVELSKEILEKANNNLSEFSKFTLNDLCKHKGIGQAKAITILAALELARRRQDQGSTQRIRITSPRIVYQLVTPIYADLYVEEFHVLLLNRANEVIRIAPVSSGGLSSTVVDPKVVFKMGIDSLASGIILTHNHPSNNLKPSEQDIRLTEKFADLGRFLDIPIIDHVIYAESGFFSFADEGLM